MGKIRLNDWERFDDLCQTNGETPIGRHYEQCQARALKGDNGEESRAIEFILSTGGVKRDGHEIVQNGWHLGDFRNNPVVLWQHGRSEQAGMVPIASSSNERLVSNAKLGKHLRGIATFHDEEKNAFADQIFRMYRDGDLRAVSVSWDTIRYERIEDDEGYTVGIRFQETNMLEWSGVAIPADPQAVMMKIQRGIYDADALTLTPEVLEVDGRAVYHLDARPGEDERERKVMIDNGAAKKKNEEKSKERETPEKEERSEDTPQAPEVTPEPTDDDKVNSERRAISYGDHGSVPKAEKERQWDGAAARKRLQAWSKDDNGDIQFSKLRDGFVWFDAERADQLGSYKGPHHDIINGRFVSVFRGVVAAAQRLIQGAFDVPEADLSGMRTHLGKEYEAHGETAPWDRASGQAYERIHQLLNEMPEGSERDALRGTAEKLAAECFGDERIREPWEKRQLPAGNESMWLATEGVLKERLADVVSDPEELDSHIDIILHDLGDAVGNRTEKGDSELLERILRTLGLEPTLEHDKIVERCQNLVGQIIKDESVSTPGDDETLERLARIQEKLAAFHQAPKVDDGSEDESRNSDSGDSDGKSSEAETNAAAEGLMQRLLDKMEGAGRTD